MRKPAFAGLLLCAIFFGVHSPKVSAEAPDILELETNSKLTNYFVLKDTNLTTADLPPQPEAPPPVITYIVKENESLTSIATAHNTTWKRLYDKNVSLANPDLITPGTELIIPAPEEVIAERNLPEPPKPPETAEATKQRPRSPQKKTLPRGSISGNGYARGYCTWYAKNRRPDLPNNLGNADTWVSRARAQGIPTGYAPRVGAIGQQGMHVVYVERVNNDGTVTISEMNFNGWNVVSSRTVSAGNFQYIY